MIKLTYYEGRKHFLNVFTVVLILLFSLINGIKIYSVYQQSSVLSEQNQSEFKEAYDLFYEEYSGKLTEEQWNKLQSIYNPIKEKVDEGTAGTEKDENSYTYNVYSDELFLRWCFVDEMDYDYHYKDYADKIVKKAVANIKFYEEKGNSCEVVKNYQIAKSFYKRAVGNFYNTEMYQYLFYYDFSSLLIIFLCIYGCSSVFVKENATGMFSIVKSSIYGKSHTFFAKLIALVFFIVFVSVLFSAEDYLFFLMNFKNADAGTQPLYALKGFQNTQLNLSMNQAFFYFSAIRLIGNLLLAISFFLVSSCFRKILSIFLINLGFTAFWVVLQDHAAEWTKIWNPISLISSRTFYFQMDFVSVMGYPIRCEYVSLVLACLLMILFTWIAYLHWKRGVRE